MRKRLLQLNKKDIFCAILAIIWAIFFFRYFVMQFKNIKPLLKFYTYNDEQKYEILDNGYYQFMQLCRKAIPETANVLFEVVPSKPVKFSREDFIMEYFLQKAPYYLYPRKVYRRQWIKEEKMDYAIVYDIEHQQFYIAQNRN